MPEAKPKDLYLCKDIEELTKKSDIQPFKKDFKKLCNVAEKLYKECEKYCKERDEEMGYLYAMRYLTMVTKLQKTKEYNNSEDKKFYLEKMPKKDVDTMLNKAEELKKSLVARYKKREEEELEKVREKLAKAHIVNKDTKPNTPEQVNGIKDDYDVSITSKELYYLLFEAKSPVLLLDARSEFDYEESHMKTPCCMNVPEELIQPGITASKLGDMLPIESRLLWSKRMNPDYIVMYDWSSQKQDVTPASKLFLLKNILLKWDPDIVYKKEPLILEGGYEDFLLKYPTCVTNPHVKPPITKENGSMEKIIEDINYPTIFEENSIPRVDRASKPATAVSSSENSIYPIVRTPAPGRDSPELVTVPSSARSETKSTTPVVDRSSKTEMLNKYKHVKKETEDAEKRGSEILDDRVKMEWEWQSIRSQLEQEADRELIEELQRREAELIEDLESREREYKKKEKEVLDLRKALEEHEKEGIKMGFTEVNKLSQDSNLPIKKTQQAEELRKKKQLADDLSSERKRKLERYRLEKPKPASAAPNRGTYMTTLKLDEPSSMSGSMKRSHSSPNIAQLVDEEKEKNPIPYFDRSIKPLDKMKSSEVNMARQRNFSPVYGSVAPGLTGLKNLGNSCYMNSVMQCINNTMPLVKYFMEGTYRDHVNRQHKTRGKIAEEVGAVIQALWSGQYRSIACRDLKSVVGEYKIQFSGCEQQDSHEFLTILMDWLHEDLKRNEIKKSLDSSSKPEDVAWEKFHASNNSQVSRLFFGQQKSTVTCCKCNETSTTYEPFSNLSLPIPTSSTNKCSLQECVISYLKEERLTGWNCPKCKEARDANKKFDILRFPEILIIHLKRFQHDGWSRKKQAFVDFPLQGLDMTQFTSCKNQRHTVFTLHGVSNHYGTMEGGHYTAYCKNSSKRTWFKFDDQEVSEMSPSDVKTNAAYILFYSSTHSVYGNEI